MKGKPIIYFDGQWMEANQTLLDSLTPGILRAQGVFETILIQEGEVCFWKEHWDRLQKGIDFFKINIKLSQRQVRRLVDEAVKVNNLSDGRLRIAIFRDEFKTMLAIVAQKNKKARPQKFKVTVSPLIRPISKDSHLKTVTYQPFYDARIQAQTFGFDEAILLNAAGYLVEGATTNLFFVSQDKLFTPSIKSGCLNGITRQIIIKCARENGIPVGIGSYTVKKLLKSDAVFVTNSIIGIRPVIQFNEKVFDRSGNRVVSLLKSGYDERLQG